MFGKIMYYDKKSIDEYKSIIQGQRQLEIIEYEISNDKGAGVDFKVISADAKASKKYTAKVVESMLYDCSEFEKMLSSREDYFDFTQTEDYDLSTVPRGTIIKADAFIEIPESFDIMRVIDTFKPVLLNNIQYDNKEQSEREALKVFFNNATATKIPIIIDVDDYLLCAKMNQNNLILEYEEFEELDEQVTILARVASGVVNSVKPFYDPLKDFMTLNRMMRRSIKDRGNGLDAITVEKDYKQIDILAIYR